MTNSEFWCVLWNPVKRYLHRERLDYYLRSNQRAFLDSKDQDRLEVLLEISNSSDEIDAKLKEWSDIQNESPR